MAKTYKGKEITTKKRGGVLRVEAKTIKKRLIEFCQRKYPDHYDKVDVSALFDSNLSYDENKERILQEFKCYETIENEVENFKPRLAQEENELKKREEISQRIRRNNQKVSLKINVQSPYKRLRLSIKALVEKRFNSVFVKSRAGLGKSWQIDELMKQLNPDAYEVFCGQMTPAYLYRYLFMNRDKIIIFRDLARMLNDGQIIDMIKAITETHGKRVLRKGTYSKQQEDLPDEFEFVGGLVFEFNNLLVAGHKFQEDITAIFSRGDYFELVLSPQEMKSLMLEIVKNDSFGKEVTFRLMEVLPRWAWSLRAQNKAIRVCRENKNWKEDINAFFSAGLSEGQLLLYNFAGEEFVKRVEFEAYLRKVKGWKERTAQRRVRDWLDTKQMFSDGLKRDSSIGLRELV